MIEAFFMVKRGFMSLGTQSADKSPNTQASMAVANNDMTPNLSQLDQDLKAEDLVIQNVSEDEAGLMFALSGAAGSSNGDADGQLVPSDRVSNNLLTSASTLHMLKTSLTEAVLSQDDNDRAALLTTFITSLVDVTLNL